MDEEEREDEGNGNLEEIDLNNSREDDSVIPDLPQPPPSPSPPPPPSRPVLPPFPRRRRPSEMVNETPPPPLPARGERAVPPALPPRPVPVISQPRPPSHPPRYPHGRSSVIQDQPSRRVRRPTSCSSCTSPGRCPEHQPAPQDEASVRQVIVPTNLVQRFVVLSEPNTLLKNETGGPIL